MSAVLGLDVGNSTCSVAVCRQGSLELVPNEDGNRCTPTCIAFTDAETLLGESARGQAVRNAANTVAECLRLLGRAHDDADFEAERAKWRFRVSKAKDGGAQVDVSLKGEAKAYSAPRLLALLLGKLRADAEAFTGEVVKETVVACPAYFGEPARAALREAAQIGGMKVRQVLSHPLAVALLYGQTHASGLSATDVAAGGSGATSIEPGAALAPPQQLLVVDIGGSSSTASVVERTQKVAGAAAAAAADGAEAAKAGAGAGADEGADQGARTCTDAYVVRASITEHGLGAKHCRARAAAQHRAHAPVKGE